MSTFFKVQVFCISQKEISASLIGRKVFLRQQLFLVRIIVPKAIKNIDLKERRRDVKRKSGVVLARAL